jgi:ABC-2 type transport system permease protein
LKLIFVSVASGAIHASLSIGVSSLFNQGRLASATYAGIYFMTYIFTQIINGVNVGAAFGGKKAPAFVQNLFYCSIDGLQIGMAKVIIGTNGSAILPGMGMAGGNNRRRGNQPVVNPDDIIIHAPSLTMILPVFVFVVATGFLIAWSRIKAVEVV